MNDFFTDLDADIGENPPKKSITDYTATVKTAPKDSTIKHIPQGDNASKNHMQKTPPQRREHHTARNNNHNGEDFTSNFSVEEMPPNIFPQIKPQFLPALQKGSTRIITIGGQNEVGKNMTAYQYEDEILLVDGGMRFSANDIPGAKYSLPDISFLIPLKNKIVGIIITNGHLHSMGGLKHILPSLGYPKIYGTKLTLGLIKQQLEDAQMLQKTQFHIVNPDSDGIFQVSAHFKIELFRENNNIPDATGVYIETPHAKLLSTGDFKFDQIPSVDIPANFAKIGQIGLRGINLLLSDSVNSLKEGFTKTEAEIGMDVHEIISQAGGRVIIALSPNLIGRVGQIIESSEKLGRTVFLDDWNMGENVKIGRNLGFIQGNPNAVRRITEKIDSIPDNQKIILMAEDQGKESSGLELIAKDKHPTVQIVPGDTVIFSTIFGIENARGAGNLMNSLIRLGATLFMRDYMDIHTSGHGSKEEQKIMISLVRPSNFMSVHGELFMRVAHKKTALSIGIPEKNIFLADNGSILEIDENGMITKNKQKLQTEEIIVDGQGIGIGTSHVIDARKQMMRSGVVTIVFKADEASKALLAHLKIETRGLVYLDEVREVHKIIIKKARASYEDTIKDVPNIEEKELIKIIRRDLEIFLSHKIGREPVIIPMIVYV